jgi:hypothetical protein
MYEIKCKGSAHTRTKARQRGSQENSQFLMILPPSRDALEHHPAFSDRDETD